MGCGLGPSYKIIWLVFGTQKKIREMKESKHEEVCGGVLFWIVPT
jgi:hypothetical protein